MKEAVYGQESLMQVAGPIRDKTTKRFYKLGSECVGYTI